MLENIVQYRNVKSYSYGSLGAKEKNLIIKGFVFKKFPVELKVMFVIAIIVNITCLVFNF